MAKNGFQINKARQLALETSPAFLLVSFVAVNKSVDFQQNINSGITSVQGVLEHSKCVLANDVIDTKIWRFIRSLPSLGSMQYWDNMSLTPHFSNSLTFFGVFVLCCCNLAQSSLDLLINAFTVAKFTLEKNLMKKFHQWHGECNCYSVFLKVLDRVCLSINSVIYEDRSSMPQLSTSTCASASKLRLLKAPLQEGRSSSEQSDASW